MNHDAAFHAGNAQTVASTQDVKNVRNVVLTVGNSMMGDDAAGPSLARLLQETPASGWTVIDGGATPENSVHTVFALNPEQVLIVDAAEMELEPGQIRQVDDRMMADLFIMSTHNLPLTFLIQRLREKIPQVHFLGIQPQVVAFQFPMSDPVRTAVTAIHRNLCSGEGFAHYPWAGEEAQE